MVRSLRSSSPRSSLHVLLVLPRQDDLVDADALGRQHLLLDAADRQHLPGQRDLAGHRDVAAHRTAASARTPAPSPSSRRPTDRPSGSRPTARGRGSPTSLKKSGSMPYAAGVRADPRQRRPRRLLHHVAELAGERQRRRRRACASPRRTARRRRPASTPGRWPRRACAVRSSTSSSRKRGAPSIVVHRRRGVSVDRRLVAFGAAPRDLAAERADLALEVADAGFARVAADHRAQRRRR